MSPDIGGVLPSARDSEVVFDGFLALNTVAVTARLSGMTAAVHAPHKAVDRRGRPQPRRLPRAGAAHRRSRRLPARQRRPKQRARLLSGHQPRRRPQALQSEADPGAGRRARRRGLRRRFRCRRGGTGQRGVLRDHRCTPCRRSAAGDHFGKPGANDRIWNAAQKLALHAPQVFAEYYANDAIGRVSGVAGPALQVTSPVNVVNPGGNQQVPHRDYHLGFVPDEHLASYPAHLHRTSQALTLQGAVAHCDMPAEAAQPCRADQKPPETRE